MNRTFEEIAEMIAERLRFFFDERGGDVSRVTDAQLLELSDDLTEAAVGIIADSTTVDISIHE